MCSSVCVSNMFVPYSDREGSLFSFCSSLWLHCCFPGPPPPCIQHIPLGRLLLLRPPSHTHTHSMDPGGKSMLRRPCFSSYGAVVREMGRQFHLCTPAANDIFRPSDAVSLLLLFFQPLVMVKASAVVHFPLININSCFLNICQMKI